MDKGGKSVKGAKGVKRLTGRQRNVVRMIALGWSMKAIGPALGISPKTAEYHRAKAMAKTGCRCAADLTRYAMQQRIIEA